MRYLIPALFMSPILAFAQTLNWATPTERENGDALAKEEIAGYEIRVVYPDSSEGFDVIAIIEDNEATGYDLAELDLLTGSYQFEIAVYDTNGLYSRFVSISPSIPDNPKAPSDFRFYLPESNIDDPCYNREKCIVIESSLIIRGN